MNVIYNRFERARIISARALQISMGAPPLIRTSGTDAVEISTEEFNREVIPITVVRE